MIYAYDKDGIIFAERVYRDFEGNANCTQKTDSEEHFPMWHPHENMLIYINSDNKRIIDIIRYEVDVPKELSHEILVDFYERICKALDARGYTPTKERYEFAIIIANNQVAYNLCGRGIVTIDDKLTPISGEFSGFGAGLGISIPMDLSPRERLLYYFDGFEKLRQVRRFPIALMRTNTKDIVIVDGLNQK